MNPIDYANLISVIKLSNSNSISKNELIQLFKELKQEFENFLSEEKIERNFPQLNQISTISMDEN